MKKGRMLGVLLLVCLCGCARKSAVQRDSKESVEDKPGVQITFSFEKQKGFATNQFAVWVENEEGQHIKTLFATDYTALGGWKKRPEALPEWIAAYTAGDKARQDSIELAAGATPSSGVQSCFWDGCGEDGQTAPDGVYHIRVEGTLRWENRVEYTAAIRLGGEAQEVQALARFLGDSEKERDMLADVAVRYIPR